MCGRQDEDYAAIAVVKRSPKMTANWALAMHYLRGGIFHSFSERFTNTNSSCMAASSVAKWPWRGRRGAGLGRHRLATVAVAAVAVRVERRLRVRSAQQLVRGACRVRGEPCVGPCGISFDSIMAARTPESPNMRMPCAESRSPA